MWGHRGDCLCELCSSLTRVFSLTNLGQGHPGFLARVLVRVRLLETELRDELLRLGPPPTLGTSPTPPAEGPRECAGLGATPPKAAGVPPPPPGPPAREGVTPASSDPPKPKRRGAEQAISTTPKGKPPDPPAGETKKEPSPSSVAVRSLQNQAIRLQEEVLRRPASRVRVPKKPAARDEEESRDDLRRVSSLGVMEIARLGPVYLPDARYYGRQVQVAGRFGKCLEEDGEHFIELRMSGTKDDELLRVLTGTSPRVLKVHMCQEECGWQLSDPLLVHGVHFQEVDLGRVPWLTNLEASHEDVPQLPQDEMAALRELQDRSRPLGPRPEKELAKKEKKMKRREEKAEEGREERTPKRKNQEMEIGQKPLADVFGGTGLDPDPVRRAKIQKKAKRVGKSRKKKKKKRSSNSSSMSSTGSSSSSSSSSAHGGTGLFDSDNKLQRIWKRYPGALTSGAAREARQGLMNQAGTLWSVEGNEIPPLFTQYSRQQVLSTSSASPALQQELLTIAQALDYALMGKIASMSDILCQRLKSLEALIKGSHWTLGRELELVRSDQFTIAEDNEAIMAARRAKEAEKLRALERAVVKKEAKEKVMVDRRMMAKQRTEEDDQGRDESLPATDFDADEKTYADVESSAEVASELRPETSEKWQTYVDCGAEKRQKVAHSFTLGEVDNLIYTAFCGAQGVQGSDTGVASAHSQDVHENSDWQLQGSSKADEDGSQQVRALVRGHIERFLKREPAGLKLVDLGPLLEDVLNVVEHIPRCRSRPLAGGKSIFPLPVSGHPAAAGPMAAFLRVVAACLNSMHGVPNVTRGSPSSLRAVKRLHGVLLDSPILQEGLAEVDFVKLFNSRGVDYQGEEIRLAKKIVWCSVEASFPKQVGELDIRNFCDAGVLYYVTHFEQFLIPESDQIPSKQPRVHVDDDEWGLVAEGLLARGICVPMRLSQLHHISGKPLVNGLFTVSKDEMKGSVELTRLIMNLRPVNSICRPLEGDTSTLPMITHLSSLYLEEGEVLSLSSEDLRCYFYLFSVPEAWCRFMGFGKVLPSHLVPEGGSNEDWVLCSRVLPMGFLNSVGIAQHIHRNIVRRAMGGITNLLGGEAELRRDKPFSSSSNLYRVYLDNFDELRKTDRKIFETITGQPSPVVEKLREAYAEARLPTHPKKSVQQAPQAEVQGAWVDGKLGIMCAKPSKMAKYVRLTLELLRQGCASQRELQVVCGGLVYVAMFKRPLLGALNQVWRAIVDLGDLPKGSRVPLPREVMAELARFIGLLPLAFSSFRFPFDMMVIASDASMDGGGFCASRGLTPYGVAASLSTVREDVPEEHDFCQVLSIGLFDGIAALRVALDILQAPMAGHISVESNPQAQRVVEANFSDVWSVSNVEEVDDALVQQWSLRYSSAGLVLVGAGPPCQGVSGLNADRRGALRDSRSSLFQHVPRIVELCKRHFPWAQVRRLAENVASMDAEDCVHMNDGYDSAPWFIDAAGIGLAHRPRLYWIDWEVHEEEGVTILYGSDGKLPIVGEIQLKADVRHHAFLEKGVKLPERGKLPTFTTARPSARPLRKPAGLNQCQSHELDRWREDRHRFPPYQYLDVNCVQVQGTFRPPNVEEREAIMGFPFGYTRQCLKKSEHGSKHHEDCRLTLIGNSWSVGVVAWLLKGLLSPLGLIEQIDLKELVRRLTPGESPQLQSLLRRPPLGHSTLTISPNELLVKKLCGLTSLKGEDIMIQSANEMPVRFQRMRASIPAKLWRWRVISGWRWTGQPEHINVLEARAVFTSLRWRVFFTEVEANNYEDQLSSFGNRAPACLELRGITAEPSGPPVSLGHQKEMAKKVQVTKNLSKEERKKVRKTMGSLKHLTVQPKTRQRYSEELQHFFSYLRGEGLRLPSRRDAMDSLVSDYLEFLWSQGEGRAMASTFLAALQDSDPKLKGCLPGSWRLMRTWVANEIPQRAPPLSDSVLRAMVGWAIMHDEPTFGLSLLVGFHGLLRTGELLGLQAWQIHMTGRATPAVISLGLTKSGKRQGAAESVTITEQSVLLPLWRSDLADSFRHARDLQRSHENRQIELGGHSANAYMKKISSLPALPSDDFTCIGCSFTSAKASSAQRMQRHLVLDPAWLVLADMENANDAVVTTVWPIWQVQSLIDRSDPRTLQIGMNAPKPGMKPGEAVAYNPPISTYFTLTLNFTDVKASNEAAVHLQTRRLAIRSQMLQQVATFVERCKGGTSADHESPVALESVSVSMGF
eukprot:s1613_g14.t1